MQDELVIATGPYSFQGIYAVGASFDVTAFIPLPSSLEPIQLHRHPEYASFVICLVASFLVTHGRACLRGAPLRG
ncbi:hypothetical protein KC19_4G064800 [Ceratodon purpureus]|uniref:Uncharacterized protein n=1 Tax=Ceratodon purpureus TaxID=3225 RepID=A0A8T0I694_CERPU|nr:hypothetical protein KC19_4G064800 [Ceratodon purpureus]